MSIDRSRYVLVLDFLAKGSSQRRKDGKVVGYNRRNPERAQLVAHVLEGLEAAGVLRPVGSLSRGDWSDWNTFEAARGAASSAGNFRFAIYLRPTGRRAIRVEDLAHLLGLKEKQHKPVTTAWPSNL